jgi:hypothetical protein
LISAAPSARDLRIFAAIVATGFACVGAFSYYRHRLEPSQTTALVLWAAGGTILVVGLVAPALLRPFHRFWTALGHVRRDPLRLASRGESHWVRREQKSIDHTRMF